MRKHRLDPFSLISGGLFTVIAALYLVSSLDSDSVDGRIVIPVTFIVLGVAGLVGAVAAMSRRGRPEPVEAPACGAVRTAPQDGEG
ncbi:hypothetical protein AB0K43_04370 [Kitasatospora sp. NPDC049258]|uniref:hypothetical protein n=1 Tax=Kitasatospora sp. NPDC049258 TaxID=3155394 RepID=UPI003434672E